MGSINSDYNCCCIITSISDYVLHKIRRDFSPNLFNVIYCPIYSGNDSESVYFSILLFLKNKQNIFKHWKSVHSPVYQIQENCVSPTIDVIGFAFDFAALWHYCGNKSICQIYNSTGLGEFGLF